MLKMLEILGFEKEDDSTYLYKTKDGYVISINLNSKDIKKSKIDYGNKIVVQRVTYQRMKILLF
jgi:hypothetical protein